MNLKDYLSKDRGVASAIAKQLKVPAPTVSLWASQKRPIPIVHCSSLEKATGGEVTRQEMRPKDWQSIWPELVEQSKKNV